MLSKICDNLKNNLTDIADMCYSGNVNTAIADMSNILPDISNLATHMTEEQGQRLVQNALSPMLVAMQTKDGAELADRITYELMPIIDELNN